MEVTLKVKKEIERLLQVGFIRTARYMEWLSNIVHVLKKNGMLCVGVDFQNVNAVSPKDQYHMPVADLLIDRAARHKFLSFLDGYFGYNQIYIAEQDVHKTTFRCHGALGTFEGEVMPFGLTNAEATYQRAMNGIFHDMNSKFMEFYIDDIVIKAASQEDHLENLRKSL